MDREVDGMTPYQDVLSTCTSRRDNGTVTLYRWINRGQTWTPPIVSGKRVRAVRSRERWVRGGFMHAALWRAFLSPARSAEARPQRCVAV
jgi:hypothetical protein